MYFPKFTSSAASPNRPPRHSKTIFKDEEVFGLDLIQEKQPLAASANGRRGDGCAEHAEGGGGRGCMGRGLRDILVPVPEPDSQVERGVRLQSLD